MSIYDLCIKSGQDPLVDGAKSIPKHNSLLL